MKLFRLLILLPFVTLTVPACAATPQPEPIPQEEGWDAFGHALTLAQVFARIAAHSDNPEQSFDEVLAGRSTEANQAFAGLFKEATAEMPSQYRERVAAIGKDLALAARKQSGASAGAPAPAARDDALQARKDLTAMGLRYHDPNDFLEAVKRDDALAVELFIAGRGVNLATKDAQGRSALEIARANGNAPMAELLSRNLRAAR
ncbi:MAG TPA: hypothetical protein VHG88_01820 [Burkholderiales bacterium]|nr:hypothetical protein [Burkholderiales bacterium]